MIKFVVNLGGRHVTFKAKPTNLKKNTKLCM